MQTDVLIVGCGPVGKLLALQLAEADHHVVIVDKQCELYPLPRAVTHDAEVARIFQSIGLAPPSISEITEPFDGMYEWFNADGNLIMEVDWRGISQTGWYNTYFFHQPDLENRMQQRLEALPNVEVWWGYEYLGHQETGDTVIADLKTPETILTCSASYLIGADGASSAVRKQTGIGWHDRGYFFDWLVLDVALREGCQFPHIAHQLCDHKRPRTAVPAGPGRRRWEFMKLPSERIEDINTSEFVWELLRAEGLSGDDVVLERHAHYRFQAGWATQLRSGRTFLAGDAAHLMPPFAGQGLGAGFRDAMNLGWKLSAVLRELADDTLLDTYACERLPHVREFVDFSVFLGTVICVTDADAAAERDDRLIAAHASREPAVPPAPRLGPGLHTGPHGGTLSIQAEVTQNSQPPQYLDDHLGGAGALILTDPPLLAALTPAHQQLLSALDISTCVLGVPACLLGQPNAPNSGTGLHVADDVHGRYRTWLEGLDAKAVLIRPDFYIYGTATDHQELDELLRSFRAALHTTIPAVERTLT